MACGGLGVIFLFFICLYKHTFLCPVQEHLGSVLILSIDRNAFFPYPIKEFEPCY